LQPAMTRENSAVRAVTLAANRSSRSVTLCVYPRPRRAYSTWASSRRITPTGHLRSYSLSSLCTCFSPVRSAVASERAAKDDITTLGSGEAFNVGRFLEESSPYAWASTGIGLCIGFSVLGAGWYILALLSGDSLC
jgi:hypothetical protein